MTGRVAAAFAHIDEIVALLEEPDITTGEVVRIVTDSRRVAEAGRRAIDGVEPEPRRQPAQSGALMDEVRAHVHRASAKRNLNFAQKIDGPAEPNWLQRAIAVPLKLARSAFVR